MKIKRQIMQSVPIDVDVELPHFRTSKNNLFYFAILEEDTIIQVTTGVKCGIVHSWVDCAFNPNLGELECTREEFEKAYTETIEMLNAAIFSVKLEETN